MPKTTTIQTAFLSGETSPRLLARVDLDTYKYACKTLENLLPFYHGGVVRRPGLYWVGEVKDSADPVLMVPFIYSRTQSYVAVFNDGYIQFLKNGEFIESSPGVRYQISHTYTNDELNEVRFAQFGNSVYFTHPLHAPAKLVRTSDTSWALSNVSFIHRALSDYWYENSYIRFKILSGSTQFLAGDDFQVVVAAGVAGTPTDPGAANTGNGTMVVSALTGAPDETWTMTCTYADSTRQEWSVSGSSSGTMVHSFRANNYPTAIAFYQQRLWLAGTPNEPQTVWSSAINDYTNLTIGTDDSDGVMLTLASNSNDLILHLVPAPTNLIIFSYANEFILDSSNGLYTPSTILGRPQTSHGCNLIPPIRVGYDVVFCQRDGRRIRSVSYDIEKSSNTARDLTVVSEHITGDGITSMSFAQDPDFVVWMAREDGEFISLTYLDEQEVVAWARHTTDGSVLSFCTIPENNTDKTYAVVERDINGSTVKYIEWIDYELESQVDSSIFGYYQMSSSDLASTLTNTSDTITHDGTTAWGIARATGSRTTGKYYFEVVVNALTDTSDLMVGIAKSTETLTNYLGQTTASYGWRADANKYFNATGASFGTSWAATDVIGVATDLDNKELHFYKNGTLVGTAYTGLDGAFMPAVALEANTASVTVRLLDDEWTEEAPSGYGQWKTTTWSGLTHLAGETVDIVGDGNVLPQATVNGSGVLTSTVAATEVEIGLHYNSTLELLHPNPEVQGGTAQGRQVSIHEIILRLQETVGAKVNGVTIPFLSVGDAMDTSPALFTGDKKVQSLGWDSPNNVLIEQVLPKPFTLLGVVMKLSVND